MKKEAWNMKFEYEAREDDRECVAYIDEQGDLMVKVENTHNNTKVACVELSGFWHFNLGWNPSEATHKFYKGDKITITF